MVLVIKPLFFLFFLVPLTCNAGSFVIDKRLSSEHMQNRADKIFEMTRCLVCSGESIRESQAPFAVNIRSFIRSEILNGRTDDEILADLRDRYGEQILSITPYEGHTYFLWILPLLAPIVLTVMMMVRLRQLKVSKQ